MARREKLIEALDRVHMPESLYAKTLDAMRQQKRRRVSFEGFGRWAAIAASIAVLALGGSFMWRYLFGDLKPEPGPVTVTPSVVTESPTPETPPPESPSPPAEPSPSPDLGYEPLQLDLSFLIDIDWPDSPASYTPEFKVFPLTSTPAVYLTGIDGPVTFVDENLNLVNLPFEPKSYIYFTAGYALHHPDYSWPHGWVLMLADGTIPRDSDGNYIMLYGEGHNFAAAHLIGATVITHGTPDRNGGAKYGLYDIEAGIQILPNEYDAIITFELTKFAVMEDSRVWLLDSKGHEIFVFPADSQAHVRMGDFSFLSSVHYIRENERLFYKEDDLARLGYDGIQRWGKNYIAYSWDGSIFSPFYLFDSDGYEIYRTRQNRFTIDGEFLTVATQEGFTVLNLNGIAFDFPVVIDWDSVVTDVRFEGGEVYWTQIYRFEHADHEWSYDYYYYAVDEAGNVRTTDQPQSGRFEGNIYNDSTARMYKLYDIYGNILLSISFDDGYINILGEFTLLSLYNDEINPVGSVPYAIYSNHDVKLLMEDIYGYVYPAPDGGIFVYLDANTCVLLYPDGRTVPVHNAPVVKRMTWG
ncbi:MAG: hypothetical protein LBI19_09110 [Oscillospiraceae bacterium]|jgi:hypothetical protein|nr:hypothetical protein [Oscillospiraceae bacterium]